MKESGSPERENKLGDEDTSSELLGRELAGLQELHAAAGKLLESLVAQTPENRRSRNIQIAAFAAYETKRNLASRHGWLVNSFYLLFLAATAASPIYVASVEPAVRVVTWDRFAIGSTMVLLYSTYGLYTAKMVWGWIKAMIPWRPSILERFRKKAKSRHAGTQDPGGNVLEGGAAVILLTIGTFLAAQAWWDLEIIHKMSISPHDESELSQYYWNYFKWVFGLAILFIIMDWSVAIFNESHSETYIAASSAAHVTIPMAIGIFLVGLYLWVEYDYASRHGDVEPWSSLSVEFASGALAFQMIVSNVLFILIKRNAVIRFYYWTIHSTNKN